jgi:molybdate transport system substrate-binding protein
MRRFALAAVALAATAVAGCSSSSSSSTASGSGSSPPASAPAASSSSAAQTGTITVFAASSLKDTFTELGKQFEAAHPGDTVKFSFGASSALATQINNGAPADVFASAAPKNMDQVVTPGNASNPQDFAKNIMEIAVPPNNPAKITSINNLASPSVKVALCQPQVPCGVVAAEVFKNAKLTVKPVLTQVELGNVDAGVVYVTDVLAAGSKVKGITIPASENATTLYPIAALTHSQYLSIAQAFVAFVLSPTGEQVLKAAGFEQP